MKELADGTSVKSFSYYFLLEWCEADNKKEIERRFGTVQLCKLKRNQFKELFLIASSNVYKEI